jgi:hypothetical protein
MSLELNNYVTIDDYLQVGQINLFGYFFKVVDIHLRKNNKFYDPLILNETVLQLAPS